MRRLVAACLFVALFAGAAVAEEPVLVSSEPENGAPDVAVDVGVLVLTFDREMKQNSHTLWLSDRGEFPPLAGKDAVTWRDAKTCEIRLGKLEPGTTYAIQLNSAKKKGFQGATDQTPLPLTVVAFRTAEAGAQPAPEITPEGRGPADADGGGAVEPPDGSPPLDWLRVGTAALEGEWVCREAEGRNVRHLRIPKLGIVQESQKFGEATLELLSGYGAYKDGVLEIWVRGRTPHIVRWRVTREGDVLDVADEEGNHRRYELATSPAAPEPKPTRDGEASLPPAAEPSQVIEGDWWYEDEDVRWEYAFREDGSFTSIRTLQEDGEPLLRSGSYTVKGTKLVILPEEEGAEELTQVIAAPDRHTLEIIDANDTVLRLFRKRSDLAPGGPADLPGTWEGTSGDVRIRLTLDPDGRMTHEQTKGGETRILDGWYKAPEGALILRLNGLREIRFRLRGMEPNGFVLGDEGEEPIAFARAGKTPEVEGRDREPEPAAEASLVGTWEFRDGEQAYVITLGADGSFSNEMTLGGRTETIRGTYDVKGGVLTARPEGDEPIQLRARLVDADHLVLVDEGGEETALTRRAAGPKAKGLFGPRQGPADDGAKPPALKAGRHVGDWLMRNEQMEMRLVLRADGTFTETIRGAQASQTTQGRYEVKDGALLATPTGKAVVRLKIRLVDDETLELLDDAGSGVQLKRQ